MSYQSHVTYKSLGRFSADNNFTSYRAMMPSGDSAGKLGVLDGPERCVLAYLTRKTRTARARTSGGRQTNPHHTRAMRRPRDGKSRYLLRKIRQTDGFIGWTSVMDRSKTRDRPFPDHLCWGSGDFILQNTDLIKMATSVTAG